MKPSFLLSVFLGLMTSYSAPIYYSFNGKINFVPQDVGGYAAAHGIVRGGAVSYVIQVDTSLPGYDLYSGVKQEQTDIPDTGSGYSVNYFFDSLPQGSLFSAAVHDLSSGSYLGYRSRTVIGTRSVVSAVFQVTLGNTNQQTQLILYLPDTTVHFLPHVGDTIQSTEDYSDSTSATSSVTTTLRVTAISNTPPASIGNSSRALASQSWVWAGLQGGSLLMQNRTGHEAEAKVFNASGKTTLSLLLHESISVPESSLPKGLFVLQVGNSGQSGLMRQVFRH